MTSKFIRVADYLAQRLAAFGAEHVFLVTGGGAMHLNDAFARNKALTPICFHHEQAAAIAAEAYFRVAGRFPVLNVTTGPGGINALNGVYGAYVDSLAMFVVSGQVKRETYLGNYQIPLRQLGDQEADIVSMVRPMVKYANVLQDPLKVREVVEKAMCLMLMGRPGPVWIDVPVDVQSAMINPLSLKEYSGDVLELLEDSDVSENAKNSIRRAVSQEALKDPCDLILRKLLEAKRPVVFAGTGVRISGALNEFLELIKLLGIPVVTGWNAHDLIPFDSEYYCGKPGTVGDRPGNFTVQNSDFLLVLGCRLNIRQISYNWKSFAPRAWKAMVDVDPAELDKPTLNTDLKVCADLKDFIPQFSVLLRGVSLPKEHRTYLKWCKERVEKYPVVLDEFRGNKSLLNPYVFVDELFRELTHSDVIVAGNGSACVIGFQAAKIKSGQRFFTNSGNASMGYDLPAAIGAAISLKGQRVICLAGDGSLMMNLQELQTVVGYNLPIKVIVINNDGYHSIRQTQQAYFSDNMFGNGPADGVTFPDFVKLSDSFGIPSVRVDSIESWNSEPVQSLMRSPSFALFDVIVDPNQTFSPKLASRKLDDGTMVSPSLEDMAPFLSRDEFFDNLIVDNNN